MTLICNHPDTPTPVAFKTCGIMPDDVYVDGEPIPLGTFLDAVHALLPDIRSETDTVRIAHCTLAVDDLCEATIYVLTNTNLNGVQDPRLAFVERVRMLHAARRIQDFVTELRQLTTVPGFLTIVGGEEIATQRLGVRGARERPS